MAKAKRKTDKIVEDPYEQDGLITQFDDGLPEPMDNGIRESQITEAGDGFVNTRSGSVYYGTAEQLKGTDQSDAESQTFLKSNRHLEMQTPRTGKGGGFKLGFGTSEPNDPDDEV